MKKVVLDTNVVISALLFGGETARLVSLWQTGAFSWLASAAIIQEYARVLAYPKFKLAEAEIRELLNEDILPFVTAVRFGKVPRVIRQDPSDDEFLACALTGKADAIVSGDHHLLELKRYREIPILDVRTFLSNLKG